MPASPVKTCKSHPTGGPQPRGTPRRLLGSGPGTLLAAAVWWALLLLMAAAGWYLAYPRG